MNPLRVLRALCFGWLVCASAVFARGSERTWPYPVDAVNLQATGRIQPVRNAEHFGGGIRRVGSNARDADSSWMATRRLAYLTA